MEVRERRWGAKDIPSTKKRCRARSFFLDPKRARSFSCPLQGRAREGERERERGREREREREEKQV